MTFPPKPADTDLPILDAIRNRWSPIAISAKPISDEDIATLFEAARWAPSSYNEQPWRYLYALKDDGEDRDKLDALLMDGNAWARNAYLLMVCFAKKTLTRGGKPNGAAEHDLGSATGYIALQCESLGLVCHQMGGFFAEKANEALGVPDDFQPIAMMAIGYPEDPESVSEEAQERDGAPRERKEQSKFVFRGKWS